jgi:hypothetical protein
MSKGITLTQLLHDDRPLDVVYFGHKFTIHYNPGAFSDEMFEGIKDREVSNVDEAVAEALDNQLQDRLDEATIQAVYNAVMEAIEQAYSATSQSDAAGQILADIMLSSGILNEEGEEYEVTPEFIKSLPIPLRGQIFRHIQEDLNPDANPTTTRAKRLQQQRRKSPSFRATS